MNARMDEVLHTHPAAASRASYGVVVALCLWWLVEAPSALIGIWRDYLVATAHFFALPLLLRTLVAPWRRITEPYAHGFDPAQSLEAMLVNGLSRIIGFLIRIVTILIGLIAELAVLASGAVLLFMWFAAPFLFYIAFFHAAPAVPALPPLPHLPALPASFTHGFF